MKRFLCLVFVCCLCCLNSFGQFKEGAFTQSYNDDKTSDSDTTDVLFSFKDYFGGLAHKNECKVGQVMAGSAIVIGGMQIYNKEYWKLPLFYTPMVASLGAGTYFHLSGRKDISTWCWAGAGITYWAMLMDGVASYKPADYPHPGKATIYSILLPGLGQIYNKEYWKLPIYWGGMLAALHFYTENSVNYQRYRDIYINSAKPGYNGPISGDVALYYRNVYRRYRDYSMLALGIVYILQIIDANVFSYMHDFAVTEDIACKITPTVITNDLQFAYNPSANLQNPALGLRFGFTF